jgi:fumarylacetoacetate (FAA) hydrolase
LPAQSAPIVKLVSYIQGEEDRLGLLMDEKVYDVHQMDNEFPDNMLEFLWEGPDIMNRLKEYARNISMQPNLYSEQSQPVDNLTLLSPVPHPVSFRDAYAFREHVETARLNRNKEMIPEFYQFPVFYFSNANSVQGPGNIYCMPDHMEKLDFELEVAAVIGKEGRNIRAEEADQHIAGFCVMNDLSARQLQSEEMKLNLGPAKGKDFATTIGPWLVTPDELQDYVVDAKDNHEGTNYNLTMTATVNGEEVSRGTMADMEWTFAEIIERCSYGVDLFPGEIIGSGTVGTGCFLELNGTGKRKDPNYNPQWLQDGDVVELKVNGLGKLHNTILQEDMTYSILEKKKGRT